METSKIWDSDSLSIFLSVVALVSAGITSYFQFFHEKTEVLVHFTQDIKLARQLSCDKQQEDPLTTIEFGSVIMNSGTESIGLVQAKAILTPFQQDNLIWSEKTEPFNMWPSVFDSLFVVNLQKEITVLIEPGEIEAINFVFEPSACDAGAILGMSYAKGNFVETERLDGLKTDSLVAIDLGVWMKFVDSNGHYSTKRCHVGSCWYEKRGQLQWRRHSSFSPKPTYDFLEFDNLSVAGAEE